MTKLYYERGGVHAIADIDYTPSPTVLRELADEVDKMSQRFFMNGLGDETWMGVVDDSETYIADFFAEMTILQPDQKAKPAMCKTPKRARSETR
jgi:hypothetical protein